MNGHYSEKVHKWPICTLQDAPTGNANQNRNDDYARYTDTESLHPTSETTITLHVNYISIKKKTTLRYHFIPTKMARIKKMDDNKRQLGWRKIRTLTHCWCECKMVRLLWKTVWQPLKGKHWRYYHVTQQCLSQGDSQRYEGTCPHKNSYINVHSSLLHDSQRVGNNPDMPNADEWIDKTGWIDPAEYHSAMKRTYRYTLQNRWLLKTLWQVKEVSNL